ncbi:hypothetical protein BSAF29S_03890 [Bacillus safensis subsp. safensis]
MAIPTIPAYPMPSTQDLPENKVNWIPDANGLFSDT